MKKWILAFLSAAGYAGLFCLLSACQCDRVDLYRSAYDLPKVFCGEDYCDDEGDNWYYPPYRYGICPSSYYRSSRCHHRSYSTCSTYRTYRTYPVYTQRTYVKVYRVSKEGCCCTAKK